MHVRPFSVLIRYTLVLSMCIPGRFGSAWEETTLAPDGVELSSKVFEPEGEIGVGLVSCLLHCLSWSTMLTNSTSTGK